MDGHNEYTGNAHTVIQATSIDHVHINGTGARPPAARPVAEWDPFALGIHRATTTTNSTRRYTTPPVRG